MTTGESMLVMVLVVLVVTNFVTAFLAAGIAGRHEDKLAQALKLIAVGHRDPSEFAAGTLRECGYLTYPVDYPGGQK